MDLTQTIKRTIEEIQESQCRNCNYGKALIALNDLRGKLDPLAAVESTTPKAPMAAIAPDGAKACNACGVAKALCEYQENKTCKDGHEGTCKQCRKELKKQANRRYRQKLNSGAAAPAAPAKTVTSKTCTGCGVDKPLEKFHVNKLGRYGRDSQCAECKNSAIRKMKEQSRSQQSEPSAVAAAASVAGASPADSDKTHQCDKCGKRFMALGSLLQHKRYNCPERKTS